MQVEKQTISMDLLSRQAFLALKESTPLCPFGGSFAIERYPEEKQWGKRDGRLPPLRAERSQPSLHSLIALEKVR